MATNSAIFKKANQLMRKGMGRPQAFKVAYSELGEPVRKTARKAARKTTVKRVVKNPTSKLTWKHTTDGVGYYAKAGRNGGFIVAPEIGGRWRLTSHDVIAVGATTHGAFSSPKEAKAQAADIVKYPRESIFSPRKNPARKTTPKTLNEMSKVQLRKYIDNLHKNREYGAEFEKATRLWNDKYHPLNNPRKKTVARARPTTTIKLFSNPKRKTQTKKKPVPIVKGHRPRSTYTDYIVSESANGKTGWKVVATFLHEKNAVEYAHALEHKNAIEKRSRYIQITTQLHELRRKSAA